MNLKPTKANVLLQPIRPLREIENGVVIPEGVKVDLQSIFRVIARGPQAGDVLPGQKVICNTYAGREIVVNLKRMRLVEQSSILAIVSSQA